MKKIIYLCLLLVNPIVNEVNAQEDKSELIIEETWLLRFKLCHLYRFYSASDFGSNRAT